MSNLGRVCEQDGAVHDGGDRIEMLLDGKEKALGGFSVRRVLPSVRRKLVGPWIFFDHMGPADFPAGQGVDVRPHPHIGIATVTYLFEGEMLHRDSLGSEQRIRPGDINLMVAGRGIVHSERQRPEVLAAPQRMHGLQLWLALPIGQEEIDPAFYHYPDADIPAVDVGGVAVRVMMGSAYGVTAPVKTYAETLYLEARLEPGQSLVLPEADERAVYVVEGSLTVGDRHLPQHSMAILRPGEQCVAAEEESRLALIGGESFEKRYIDWNFVSSRKERIEQARDDWRNGRFPSVPGDDVEFIPLPE